MTRKVYDFIGVGVGPFNLGLAALTSNIDEIDGLFLDQRTGFDWHPGLMIEGVHLQTPFMSDLVTLADPTHPLSFLNYIKKQGRLYSFYIREDFFLLRQEYNHYCQWAISQMDHIRWNKHVDLAKKNQHEDIYELQVLDQLTGLTEVYYTKKLILGTGPSPSWPSCCDEIANRQDHVIHSGQYLFHKEALQKQNSITVLGSGQSAAEVFYDLLQEIDNHAYTLNWVTSAPRFYPLEYTKLTLEMTSPEYVDYFYNLPNQQRKQLVSNQKNLYKGINGCLINEIFDLLYNKRVKLDHTGEVLKVNILTNSKLIAASSEQEHIKLGFEHTEQQKPFELNTKALVLCTGYQYSEPKFLAGLKPHIRYDNEGQFDVNRNYTIDEAGEDIFVQNAELHTHGFVSPDLGMACYRNSYILREITGKEYYPVEEHIAFQEFGAPNFETKENVASNQEDTDKLAINGSI
ncbi:MAG: SidA/IucD/PvdA family monooxygenase, partial [Pseudomonadales bacterium]|nr:SidA/IucD/PvdA family monooxygenase [Pseudomonadales bacterium]